MNIIIGRFHKILISCDQEVQDIKITYLIHFGFHNEVIIIVIKSLSSSSRYP